ncbi:MAG: EI24 domain-containing protein [Oligoflexales bacterium]
MLGLSQFFEGLKAYPTGVHWLWTHKKYFSLLMLPWFVSGVSIISFWHYLFTATDNVSQWFFFTKPEDGILWLGLYYLSFGLFYLALLGLSLLLGLLMLNVLFAPIYEWISCAIEKDRTGKVHSVTFGRSLLLIKEELKKVVVIGIASLLALCIPFLNILIVAFLIGWDFYDYPLARAGLNFGERWRAVRKDFLAVTGLGLWLVVPFCQIFLLPFAIGGGTLLGLAGLQKANARGLR